MSCSIALDSGFTARCPRETSASDEPHLPARRVPSQPVGLLVREGLGACAQAGSTAPRRDAGGVQRGSVERRKSKKKGEDARERKEHNGEKRNRPKELGQRLSR